MASSPLVEPATLASWLGVTFAPDSTEESRAGTVIGVLSGFARSTAGQPDWNLTNVPEDVSAVVLMVAVRNWVNPDGKTSVTIEDITRRWENGTLFSDAELATFKRYRKGGSGGLSSVQFTRGGSTPSPSTPVVGGQPVVLYDPPGY